MKEGYIRILLGHLIEIAKRTSDDNIRTLVDEVLHYLFTVLCGRYVFFINSLNSCIFYRKAASVMLITPTGIIYIGVKDKSDNKFIRICGLCRSSIYGCGSTFLCLRTGRSCSTGRLQIGAGCHADNHSNC